MIEVRWDDFEAAFFIGSPDAQYFFNRETGETVYTSHMDGETVRERILRQTKADPWIAIPRATPDDGLAEIRAFAEAQEDEALKAKLLAALETNHPPMAFNKALDPESRRRWRAALQAGIERRLLAFCTEHELEIDDERFRKLKE